MNFLALCSNTAGTQNLRLALGLCRSFAGFASVLRCQKLASVYMEGLTDHVDDAGIVHPLFLQTSVGTGRLSCVEPNLQVRNHLSA